ncbi:NAD(P)H-dependent oxidoreductase [Mycobacterium sp. CBMA293]|uniref:NADPH-dependent FMN reductase n=1 Tax=unclassified Mycolicibacterium TaxID=2636767 RepID=UPI0012DCBCA6|nr:MULTISPECIES: NAD(P)H-dependent oxidoreductase [unclassified Mycolicibacterium]MUL44384.1 NAD(P)H-dependent oxidoreductase [Mycolicibacterium sp. CBMA 360]MUL59702.1 NAD(P)H-dependent oxidoreductase [Mycolicibacterium sp. CBMA 335]MUL68545.1 NAD(P)H-dependent oxidoreductase [Mycolicibacterium sp. CBMA 311]MUL97198.1 NAD(P)H-dependent oxidoreductase [Mycolicibacterium sp. CBMA 230]MUM06311.1 NADPH-dependent FMN reductase [Mycolicibacterium sp. CBMA 213]
MRIGIVIGSIREGRSGAAVGAWVAEHAAQRTDAQFEVIDLKAFDVPLLTSATVPAAAGKQYESDNVKRWSAAIDACDGFVFVTPEYNHGVPGALKNAVDSLGSEWSSKTVGFVSYGADGGVRSVEQWRQIIVNFQMLDVRAQVSLSLFAEFGADGFTPLERRTGELTTLLDQLISLTAKVNA